MKQLCCQNVTRIWISFILIVGLLTFGWQAQNAQAAAAVTFKSVVGGGSFTLALQTDGTVWSLGYNAQGQLGDGTTTDRNYIKAVPGLTNVKSIAAGGGHAVALKNDGTVWTWGLNDKGQLGNGTQTNSSVPVKVNSLSSITEIVAGDYHTLALKSDGTVWAWGKNDFGQLGNNTTISDTSPTQQSTPVQVSGLTNVKSIAAGRSFSLALKTEGSVWGWGSNFFYPLGGTSYNHTTPVLIAGLPINVTAISGHNMSHHSLALTANGEVWAWGYNSYGQLGDGVASAYDNNRKDNMPKKVKDSAGSGTLSSITAIESGMSTSYALDSNGAVWAWGSNNAGAMGAGNYSYMSSKPNKIFGNTLPSDITAIGAATSGGMAITSDGKLWGWGMITQQNPPQYTPGPIKGEPQKTVEATASSSAPVAGDGVNITLTVKDGLGNTDTTFTGAKNVTVSGVTAAPNASYGSFNGTTLTSGSQTVSVSFSNGVATAALKLNHASTQSVVFSVATVDTPAASALSMTPVAAAAASLTVTTQPVPGTVSAQAFATQPKVTLKDAYGNVCATGTSATATVTASAKAGTGSWTIGGTTSRTAVAGVVTFTDLTSTHDSDGNGSILFTAGTLTVTSSQFTIPNPPVKTLTAVTTDNDVDHDIVITFDADADFEAAVTGVKFGGTALVRNTDYTIGSGTITLKPSGGNTALRTPKTALVEVAATGYGNSKVSQTITAGKATHLNVTTQPVPGTVSGQAFATQPVIKLVDQYGNTASNGPSASDAVTASAKAGTGSWTLGGTATATAVNGIVSFTDLTLALVSYGNGQMVFGSGTLQTESSVFAIPPDIPTVPVIVTVRGGDSHAVVRWNSVPEATGYQVYWSTVSGVRTGLPAIVAGTENSYEISGLTNGTTYYVSVAATNVAGVSASSPEASVTPQVAPPGVPVIQSVTAGDARVKLTWGRVEGATGYNVYISTASGSYSAPVATVSASVYTEYSYEASALVNGTTYYFVVQATNPGGDSGNSSEVTATPQVPAPGAPSDLRATAGFETIRLEWSGMLGAAGYKVYKGTVSGQYESEIATVAGAVYGTVTGNVYGYDVTGLTDRTRYYFVVRAMNPGGMSGNSNEANASALTVPGAPTDVTATAGNGQATVSFNPPVNNGGSALTRFVVTSAPGGITASGVETSILVTGLSNGTAYTFTVRAENEFGIGPASQASAPVTPKAPEESGGPGPVDTGSGDPSPSSPSSPGGAPAPTPASGVEIWINGKVETAGTAVSSKLGDKSVTTVIVDEKKLNDKLQNEGSAPVVTIPLPASDIAIGQLNGQIVKAMEGKEGVFKVQTDSATYVLPALQIRMDSLSEQLGTGIALKDITVQIVISKASESVSHSLEKAAKDGNYSVVAEPLDFTVKASYGDKTVEIHTFDAYVERTVALAPNTDPNKITTGVVVEPNGAVRHVPTQVVRQGETYHARIRSLTNSSYAVIWNPVTFRDTAGHWAEEVIQDMGSRMVVGGTGDSRFDPDRNMTRAEFAAIVVRALGLAPETNSRTFADIGPAVWYRGYVAAAYAHGIVTGYDDNRYGPDETITREQAVTMLSRAMMLTGLKTGVAANSAGSLLAGYEDGGSVSDYAKLPMALVVQAGIVSGRSETLLAPQASVTRAEVAVIVCRLLQASDLI
ncbi:fibronectin type III domain-containing protein [Paenibacillus hodogayensis]|uniref:Fibronectin type III domain-containing protein n=1 Tax=Paenibacillus hodogayensis TaxID=279208 RepID=A0ABV5VPR5_9BACL